MMAGPPRVLPLCVVAHSGCLVPSRHATSSPLTTPRDRTLGRWWAAASLSCSLIIASCDTSQRCEDLPDQGERDRCIYSEIMDLGVDQVARVEARSMLIEDPIVRSAAVESWVRGHQGSLDRSQGERLCALLQPTLAGRCARWLSCSHLQR
jgi:hypothetical protein